MSKLIKYIFSLAVSMSFVVSLNAGTPNIKPGMWQWNMTMEMQGMQFALPPVTYNACVTKEDLIPQQSVPNQECKVLSSKVTKSGVKWKIECSSGNVKSVSEGTMVYNNTSANGEVKVIAQGMTMVSKLNGNYKGKCSK